MPTPASTTGGSTAGGAGTRAAASSRPTAAATKTAAKQQSTQAWVHNDRAQAAAWKTLPSWAVVATADNAIHPDAERHMARRAGAETIEVDASHSIALSQPDAVADLIQTAVHRTSAVTAGV